MLLLAGRFKCLHMFFDTFLLKTWSFSFFPEYPKSETSNEYRHEGVLKGIALSCPSPRHSLWGKSPVELEAAEAVP